MSCQWCGQEIPFSNRWTVVLRQYCSQDCARTAYKDRNERLQETQQHQDAQRTTHLPYAGNRRAGNKRLVLAAPFALLDGFDEACPSWPAPTDFTHLQQLIEEIDVLVSIQAVSLADGRDIQLQLRGDHSTGMG